MDIGGWLIAGTAVYAAVLSTYQEIVRQREKRPNLRVVTALGTNMGQSELGPQIWIAVYNHNRRPVTISAFGFIIPPDKREHYMLNPPKPGSTPLPVDIPPEGNVAFFTEPAWIAGVLKDNGLSGQVSLVGFCRTALNKQYRSKPLTLDTEQWGT